MYKGTIQVSKNFRRLSSRTSGSWWAATAATYCPGRMAEYTQNCVNGRFLPTWLVPLVLHFISLTRFAINSRKWRTNASESASHHLGHHLDLQIRFVFSAFQFYTVKNYERVRYKWLKLVYAHSSRLICVLEILSPLHLSFRNALRCAWTATWTPSTSSPGSTRRGSGERAATCERVSDLGRSEKFKIVDCAFIQLIQYVIPLSTSRWGLTSVNTRRRKNDGSSNFLICYLC